MTLFTANLAVIVKRFYLMMAVIFASFFAGVPILALLAVPIFMAALMGITFVPKKEDKVHVDQNEVKELGQMHVAA